MQRILIALMVAILAVAPACGGVDESSDPSSSAADPNPFDPINDAPQEIGGFSPSMFQFTTQVEDDKEGKGGGYQVATTKLRFVDSRQNPTAIWGCTAIVGMPIRTMRYRFVPATRAAEISADVATRATSVVMHSRPAWLRVAFCLALQKQMNAMFAVEYDGLGARAFIR